MIEGCGIRVPMRVLRRSVYSVGRKKPTSHHRCVRADSGVFIANPEGK